jgi:TolB-like protein
MSEAGQVEEPKDLSSEQVRSVRSELDSIVSSSAFVGSWRCQEFLRFVVERALEGEFENLRERMIGVELFGRRVDYDRSNDAVVRVRATEVRKRLNQHYSGLDTRPNVRIELPAGSYVPKFHWAHPQMPIEAPAQSNGRISTDETATEVDASQGTRMANEIWRHWRLLACGLAALCIVAFVSYLILRNWFPSDRRIHSLAVLPLQNLSGDPKQEYFADALTEELTVSLGHVSALRVISRTSAEVYKGSNKALPEIARALGVDAVVEGAVALDGDEARITAHLVDAGTDRQIWARTYIRSVNSVLALQGEVAQEIADAVSIELTPDEKTRLARLQPVDIEAQNLYLLGAHVMDLGDPQQALGYFQRAIEEDPDFARAHAALADCYGWLGQLGLMPYSEAFSNEKVEAMKAIQLDEDLPLGHLELGDAALNLDWDWATQEKEIKRALQLNPSSAPAHWAYCLMLEKLGRIPEALDELKIFLVLDPVSNRSFVNSADAYYFARQYDLALTQIKRVDQPTSPGSASFVQAIIHAETGAYDEAVKTFLKLGDHAHPLGHLGNVYARAGRVAEARAIIPRLEEQVRERGIGAYEIALVYAGLGENDQAFEWLEKAYSMRNKGLTYLKIDPCLDPLRSDPRFTNLLSRVGLLS